ncbi:hypothetical protein FA15DRAFT_583210, partial [Coprinopsis marcescibilis]
TQRTSSPIPNSDVSTSLLFSNITPTTLKRPAEDYSGLVAQLSREKRFKPEDKKTLMQWSKRTEREQNIILMAEILSIKGCLTHIVPPDAKVTLSDSIKTRIDNCCFQVLMDPSASAYVASPSVSDTVKVLVFNTSDAASNETQGNAAYLSAVTARIQEHLANQRCNIKAVLMASVFVKSKGDEPAPLRERLPVPLTILELANRVVKIRKPARVSLTVGLLVRLAFLRNCVVTTPPSVNQRDWWTWVDSQLKKMQSERPDPVEISKLFCLILETDMNEFGKIDLDAIQND